MDYINGFHGDWNKMIGIVFNKQFYIIEVWNHGCIDGYRLTFQGNNGESIDYDYKFKTFDEAQKLVDFLRKLE